MVRARASAGPLPRVLAMAVLLFGVAFTHGVNAESVKGHLVTSAAVPATVLPEETLDVADTQALPRPAHEDHGSSHPSEHCVSGQPQQGPVLTPPRCAASVGESVGSERALAQRGLNGSALSVSSAADLRLSVVQQV